MSSKTNVNLRRLLFMYFAALAVLFTSVVTSLVLTEMVSQQIETDAGEINSTGRQRMLSQRIIYLAQDLQTGGVDTHDTRLALGDAVDELEAAIDLFEQSHLSLSTSDTLDRTRMALYFNQIDGQSSLDTRVREYLKFARNIVNDVEEDTSLDGLKAIERAGLLTDLDTVVAATEAASVRRLEKLRSIGMYSLLLALLIIAVEVAFVFLPGHRMISDTLATLRKKNAQLDRAQSTVEAKNAALAAQNMKITADKVEIETAWSTSEQLRKEQAEFTYAVSHDLKSPANTIHLILNEMQYDHIQKLDEDGQELVAMALETVERMEDQIEDLLRYCWAADPKSTSETFEIEACLLDAIDDLSDDIDQTSAEITWDPLPSFDGHASQIRMLFESLIHNAIKFQHADAIPRVHITAARHRDGNVLDIKVNDNGIGISPENLSRIFGLFQRLHARDSYSGTGLGLPTCHRIASNHDGEILVTSTEGKGSCFTVRLRSQKQSGAHPIPDTVNQIEDAA